MGLLVPPYQHRHPLPSLRFETARNLYNVVLFEGFIRLSAMCRYRGYKALKGESDPGWVLS